MPTRRIMVLSAMTTVATVIALKGLRTVAAYHAFETSNSTVAKFAKAAVGSL